MGLDLGAALSNLANKISGGGSGDGGASNVGATGGASGASGGSRVNSYQANNAAETAIGEQLSGNKYEAESAKTIEEKASAALDELMSSLGLTAGDAEDALTEMSSAIETEIETREAEKEQELKETVEDSIVNETEETEETEVDPEVQEILDGMTDEELEAMKKAIEQEQKDREFTDEEAKTFAAGEEEVQARVKEAIENNPDMDPAEVEAKVREAYELENPEYAAAAEEAVKVLEEHNAAMDEAYAAYQEENPMPNEADYSNPSEYLAAMNEWTVAAEEHMNEQEAKYREENENYDNLMDAVEWENTNDIIEKIKGKLKEPGLLSGIAEGAGSGILGGITEGSGILSGIAEGAGSGILGGITNEKLDDIAKEMLENTEKYMQENKLTLDDAVERSGDQEIIDMINDGFLPPDFGAGVSDVEIAAYRHWKEQQ